MSDRTSDELLDGFRLRDFYVMVLLAGGSRPSSLRNLLSLRRGPLYVRSATARIVARGLLTRDGDRYFLTDDGTRASS